MDRADGRRGRADGARRAYSFVVCVTCEHSKSKKDRFARRKSSTVPVHVFNSYCLVPAVLRYAPIRRPIRGCPERGVYSLMSSVLASE